MMVVRTVWLQVHLRRLYYAQCGTGMQQVAWLERHARMTPRLAQAMAQWCSQLPVKHVAAMFDLHWSTVREIDRRHLRERLSELPPAQPRRLIMDEFAMHKGHRYASVVLDADNKRLLWIGMGRAWASVREFFIGLGREGCAKI